MNQPVNPEPTQRPVMGASHQTELTEPNVMQLLKRSESGAKNFYWIAALSAINSLVLQFGGNSYFVVGLAGTLFVDSMFVVIAGQMPEIATVLKVVGLTISLVIAGVFALIGFLSIKRKRWAFITGIVFYVIDTLIMLAFRDWMGLLFHALFLFGLINGFNALNRLQKVLPQSRSDFPQNIGGS